MKDDAMPQWFDVDDVLPARLTTGTFGSKEVVMRKVYKDGDVKLTKGVYIDFGDKFGNAETGRPFRFWKDTENDESSIGKVSRNKWEPMFSVTHWMPT